MVGDFRVSSGAICLARGRVGKDTDPLLPGRCLRGGCLRKKSATRKWARLGTRMVMDMELQMIITVLVRGSNHPACTRSVMNGKMAAEGLCVGIWTDRQLCNTMVGCFSGSTGSGVGAVHKMTYLHSTLGSPLTEGLDGCYHVTDSSLPVPKYMYETFQTHLISSSHMGCADRPSEGSKRRRATIPLPVSSEVICVSSGHT